MVHFLIIFLVYFSIIIYTLLLISASFYLQNTLPNSIQQKITNLHHKA